MAQPPFNVRTSNGNRHQDNEVERYEHYQAFGGFVVKAHQVFRNEHEVHQADCGKHAGFLQQEDNVGDKRWEAQRNCLRKHNVAHGLQFRKAQADSALTLDGLHVFQASTERFGHVGTAVQCKANHTAHFRCDGEAHARQAKIEEEQLNKQWRVAEQLDVYATKLAKHRDAEVHDHGHNEADDDGSGDADPSDAQRQPRRILVQRKVLRHGVEVQRGILSTLQNLSV